MKKILPIVLVLFVCVFAITLSRCKHTRKVEVLSHLDSTTINEETTGDDNITIIGEPDTTSSLISDRDSQQEAGLEIPNLLSKVPHQLLKRIGYTASYNQSTKNANWVAWHLIKDHTDGPWSRDGIPYMVDEEVKGKRQELEDWDNLRLPVDHGHLCPAGDNKWSQKAMEQTFLLTNMSPQNSELNRGDWEKLESRCRGWANHYGDIYIVAGPIFYTNKYKTIGANRVGVPDAFFKVILCLNKKPKAIGFIYPNVGDHHDMIDYVKTVDEVENITGIDFFYNLPDDIENQVEAVSNFNKW